MVIKAYSVYMATVLLFVGQLEDAPEGFDDIEDRACRKLFTGPWKWIVPEVLHNLTRLHFLIELCNARKLAVAAKSRVVRSENAGEGGLKIRARARFSLCLNTEALSVEQATSQYATSHSILQSRAYHLYALYKLHNLLRNTFNHSGDLDGSYRQFYAEARLSISF